MLSKTQKYNLRYDSVEQKRKTLIKKKKKSVAKYKVKGHPKEKNPNILLAEREIRKVQNSVYNCYHLCAKNTKKNVNACVCIIYLWKSVLNCKVQGASRERHWDVGVVHRGGEEERLTFHFPFITFCILC